MGKSKDRQEWSHKNSNLSLAPRFSEVEKEEHVLLLNRLNGLSEAVKTAELKPTIDLVTSLKRGANEIYETPNDRTLDRGHLDPALNLLL